MVEVAVEVRRRTRPTRFVLVVVCCVERTVPLYVRHWGAADAEIKVPADKNTELKRSPFKACSRSVL